MASGDQERIVRNASENQPFIAKTAYLFSLSVCRAVDAIGNKSVRFCAR